MSTRTPSPSSLASAAAAIRQLSLSLPTAYEDAPWGFPVFKLEGAIKMSDEERLLALAFDWVRLFGRDGWVAQTEGREPLGYALLWVEESWWLRMRLSCSGSWRLTVFSSCDGAVRRAPGGRDLPGCARLAPLLAPRLLPGGDRRWLRCALGLGAHRATVGRLLGFRRLRMPQRG